MLLHLPIKVSERGIVTTEQLNKPAPGVELLRVEDSFRRATFNWALSTMKMVEVSQAVCDSTKVPRAALADIEHAKTLLDSMFIPRVTKGNTGGEECAVSSGDLRDAAADLISRITAPPVVVSEIPPLPAPSNMFKGVDLSAPVHSKGSKMLWADHDCTVCPSKASQRCQKSSGEFLEKPHPQRKNISEGALKTDANVGEEQGERDLARIEVAPETVVEGA